MVFLGIDYVFRVVELIQFSRSNHQSNWKVKSRAQAAAWNWRFMGVRGDYLLIMIEAYFPPCRTGGPVGTFDGQQRPVQT